MNAKKILRTDLQQMIFLGMIVAMKIILGQFSFGPTTVKVGLGFIGSVLLAYFLVQFGAQLVVESVTWSPLLFLAIKEASLLVLL